jgi:excisionase family DNA binding protein
VERLCYSVDEAAALLGLNRKSVYAGIKRHEIPAIHVGDRVLVPKVGLERLMNDSAEKSAPVGSSKGA